MAVDAVLRIRDSGNLDYIQIIRKPGGSLSDSFLEEGFILEKTFGVGQRKEWEHPTILLANTPMDTDKIKVCLELIDRICIIIIDCRFTALEFVWTALPRSLRSKRPRR